LKNPLQYQLKNIKIMSSKETISAEFISQNWYHLFCRRFKDSRGREFTKSDVCRVVILTSFEWFSTPEGSGYWRMIDRIWQRIYDSME
jgi:hypothetical protein